MHQCSSTLRIVSDAHHGQSSVMTKSKILVTGASGCLGKLVLEELLRRNAGPIVATTRKPDSLADFAQRGVEVRRADFDDPSSLPDAFSGVQRALLISTDALDRPGRRREQHERAVKAFEAAGVGHILYTSMPKPAGSAMSIASDHEATEKAIAATTSDFTILRNNLYMHFLLPAAGSAVASGKLTDARGQGKVAFVTREDCAVAAAGALIEREGRSTLDVTGPEALSSADVAALLTEITGKKVAHVVTSPADYLAALTSRGTPQAFAEMLVSFDVAISTGILEDVTDAVQRVGGRNPQSVREFLVANKAALGA
jgi:NAD(P)H dehydrogenase (quinone)